MGTRPELRQCPFCGSTGDDVVLALWMEMLPNGSTFANGAEVRCNNCGGHVDHEDQDIAVNLWNGKGFTLPEEA